MSAGLPPTPRARRSGDLRARSGARLRPALLLEVVLLQPGRESLSASSAGRPEGTLLLGLENNTKAMAKSSFRAHTLRPSLQLGVPTSCSLYFADRKGTPKLFLVVVCVCVWGGPEATLRLLPYTFLCAPARVHGRDRHELLQEKIAQDTSVHTAPGTRNFSSGAGGALPTPG